MNPNKLYTPVLVASALIASSVLAQMPRIDFPAPSPGCTLKQRVGTTDIEVVYSRPSCKGRPVFGGIIPFGEVWRTGANALTRVNFSTSVKLNGTDIPAGQYALLTIPGENEWTIIISKTPNASIANYNPTNDLVRFKAAPIQLAESIETFTVEFADIRDDSANLDLVWERTVVPIKIQLDVVSKVLAQIDAAMASSSPKQTYLYYSAALFYFNHGQDLDKALDWVNKGLEGNSPIGYELYNLKAQILAKKGDKPGAIAAAKQSSELALKSGSAARSFIKMNDDLISSQR